MAPQRRASAKTYSRRSNRSLVFDLAANAKRPASATLQTAKSTAVAKTTSTRKTKSSSKAPPRASAVGDSSPGFTDSRNYDQDDELVGWTINRSSHRVFILTLRSTDKSQRSVPEKMVQQKTPAKLDAYWRAFDRPREKTLNTDRYHVFDILAYDSSRAAFKIQWVGYGTSDAETTWELVKKVKQMEPDLVVKFVEREGLDKELKSLL
ncbi:hypothetical protein GQ607_015214 [Colletotrichum asianum]|uniref:Chromo domain-containing protein n=1 Tax=Colletotrichum asianum TaxID=702518 RepID=A0A8H3W1R2_9PEZI|nr:hypothetical protein GQ607_015214 [Colletotrichum asianum]